MALEQAVDRAWPRQSRLSLDAIVDAQAVGARAAAGAVDDDLRAGCVEGRDRLPAESLLVGVEALAAGGERQRKQDDGEKGAQGA